MSNSKTTQLSKSLGTWEVMVAGVALVVAASTLVSDFTGYFTLGWAFAIALALGFGINLLLGLSAADLSVAHPRAGALYDYARSIVSGRAGQFLGVFLGLSFFGMFAFASAGETAAGAFGLQVLLGSEAPLGLFIALLSILAVIPNLLGIRTAAWVSAGLLVFMLGIRWLFGIAGFLGLNQLGDWSAANLNAGVGASDWFGETGIVSAGLALAFWSFVGIEFAGGLAEEVKAPRRAMPRGIILGLFVILATSLVMGLGVGGAQPVAAWQQAVAGELGRGGEAPQLAVGQLMFGKFGFTLMALASVSATLGTLTVAYAAMPRILYSVARDGRLFGPLSRHFATLHPRFGTPANAILFSLALYLVPALWSNEVMGWVYSAAYAWILLYVVYHVLAIVNRFRHPRANRAFTGRWFVPAAATGILVTLAGLWFAFAGEHAVHGLRALIVLGSALAVSAISFALPRCVSTPETHTTTVVPEVAPAEPA